MKTILEFPRERGFLKALKINFKGGVVFPSHRTFRNSVASRKELAAWLADLPRPIGVFAACNHCGTSRRQTHRRHRR